MPQYYPSIPENLQKWALEQPLFFTATAPTFGSHINVSPKGYVSSSLAVLDPNRAAYLDATGSGCETISHVYDNGRITLMWCSFGSGPRIMRWFGRGTVIEKGNPRWDEARAWFTKTESEAVVGARAVILIEIFKVQTACGYSVPVSPSVVSQELAAKQAPGKVVKDGLQLTTEVDLNSTREPFLVSNLFFKSSFT
jgi:hypothetical protein